MNFRHFMRTRNYTLIGGSLLVLLFLYLTDPNGGAITATFLAQMATPVIAVWFSYLSRIALFDYLDMKELYLKAKETALGSGLVFVGVCIVIFGLLGLFGSNARAQSVETFIPTKARTYVPVVRTELNNLWWTHPQKWLVASLIEHESCITLSHSKCWDPTSKLKTSREEGAGFFQLTRAYNSNGTIRFDTLTELRNRYRSELYELSWNNVYNRPDLQVKAGILKLKETFNNFSNINTSIEHKLAFTDAAYNGGITGVNNERRACKLSSWCDPNKWFNNVEKFCLKSKSVLYGKRSACDINRHHVKDVMLIRSDKYRQFFI